MATLVGGIVLVSSSSIFWQSQPARSQVTAQTIQNMGKKVCSVMGGRSKPDRQTFVVMTQVLDEDLADANPISLALNRYVLKNCPKDYLTYQQRKRRSNPFAQNPLIVKTEVPLLNNGNNTAQTAADYRKQGQSFLTARNYSDAITAYDRAISLAPSTANYYYERAGVFYLAKKLAPALKDLDRAIELNPSDADFYVGRGAILAEMGDKENALANYDRAISLNPKLGAAYYRRSLLRSKLGDVEGAKTDRATATELGFKVAK